MSEKIALMVGFEGKLKVKLFNDTNTKFKSEVTNGKAVNLTQLTQINLLFSSNITIHFHSRHTKSSPFQIHFLSTFK